MVLSAVIPEWQAAALDVLAKRDAGTRSSALRSVLARGLLNELRERDEQ